jgi:hypothetical protein
MVPGTGILKFPDTPFFLNTAAENRTVGNLENRITYVRRGMEKLEKACANFRRMNGNKKKTYANLRRMNGSKKKTYANLRRIDPPPAGYTKTSAGWTETRRTPAQISAGWTHRPPDIRKRPPDGRKQEERLPEFPPHGPTARRIYVNVRRMDGNKEI